MFVIETEWLVLWICLLALGQESGQIRWRVEGGVLARWGMTSWRQLSCPVVVRVPTKCCVECTGLARNPVKPGGDCRCGSIWSPVIRPMAAGTDDPGGSSPSELCTAYITLKRSCSYNYLIWYRFVFDTEFGSDYDIRFLYYIYNFVSYKMVRKSTPGFVT